ncbi:hypothetical protein ANN_11642 [Periplaneta americana]|uniref:Reverse transcriptase domain-containing protein n=1 Tax=Periplaneta americana TaxID=6978 RepID=A0ABQ8T6Z8_PERAM|nr:hypothetical protein ANN_11642 [Periplaneta americana]
MAGLCEDGNEPPGSVKAIWGGGEARLGRGLCVTLQARRSLPSKETLRGHSDSSFQGEGYIQCCVGVTLCDMYSNQELAEIHFMYGKADGNAALARRLYQERTTGEDSEGCEHDSYQHTKGALQVNVPHMTVWRLLKEYQLYPYHLQRVQALSPADYPARFRFFGIRNTSLLSWTPTYNIGNRPSVDAAKAARYWTLPQGNMSNKGIQEWNEVAPQGIQIDEYTRLNTTIYADDQVLFAETEDELQRSVFKLQMVLKEYNMKISTEKTKVMAVYHSTGGLPELLALSRPPWNVAKRRWMVSATSTRGGPTRGEDSPWTDGGLGEVAEAGMIGVYGFLLAVGTGR